MSQNSFLQRNSVLHCDHEVQSVYEISHRQDCESYRVAKKAESVFAYPKAKLHVKIMLLPHTEHYLA